MKAVLLIIFMVISFSLGLTAFLWEQLAVAIAFAIIIPVSLLYVLISGRYKKESRKTVEKKRQTAVDNYFHPAEKS